MDIGNKTKPHKLLSRRNKPCATRTPGVTSRLIHNIISYILEKSLCIYDFYMLQWKLRARSLMPIDLRGARYLAIASILFGSAPKNSPDDKQGMQVHKFEHCGQSHCRFRSVLVAFLARRCQNDGKTGSYALAYDVSQTVQDSVVVIAMSFIL